MRLVRVFDLGPIVYTDVILRFGIDGSRSRQNNHGEMSSMPPQYWIPSR